MASGLESRDDLLRVHSRLDKFERDFALHWFGLLGDEDDAHAAFADLLLQCVLADNSADRFRQWFVDGGGSAQHQVDRRSGEARVRCVDLQHLLDLPSRVVVFHFHIEERRALTLGQIPAFREDRVEVGKFW